MYSLLKGFAYSKGNPFFLLLNLLYQNLGRVSNFRVGEGEEDLKNLFCGENVPGAEVAVKSV